MAYLNQYQYSYKQKKSGVSYTVQVTLFQKSSYSALGTPTITQLKAIAPGLKVSIVDNDKNKFKVIRGKQAVLTFKVEPTINASTFSTGPDDEWIVECIVVETGYILFKGFLVMDDHQQPFLPPSHNYEVELTATDNLGTLSEVQLTDDSGNYMRGKKKIIEIIAQCLRKTGMNLNINVRDSWMEESQTSFSPACDVTYLDMKTFEKSIGEAVDCKQALEIISAYRLTISQKNGEWWIENVDEKTGGNAYVFQFDSNATYLGPATVTTYNQSIGSTQPIKLRDKNAIKTFVRPYKYAKLTFNYTPPAEIVNNIDFSRGITPIGSPTSVTGGYIQKYVFDNWTLYKNSTPNPSDAQGYVQKFFTDINLTYEKERFVVIHTLVNGFFYWAVDERIPVQKNDKFTISVDSKFDQDISGSGFYRYGMIQVVLHGDDGSTWKFHGGTSADPTPRWNSGTFDVYVVREGDLSEDLREWKTASAEAPPIPVDGELEIRLSRTTQVGTETHFANLQFDYMPFLNGAYSKYRGQSFKVEQPGNYKANIDDQIYIGDAPRKLLKGAMFKLVSGKYVLTGNWFAGGDLLNQSIIPPYPPSSIYLHPFGFLQIYAVWNQYNRQMVQLDGSALGLRLDSDVPELTDNYLVDAAVDGMNNKSFMLVGTEQTYNNDSSTLNLVETGDSTIAKDFTSPLTFKYEP